MLAISNQMDINSQQVLHNIGYSAGYKLSGRISSLIDEYLENACYLLEPSYSCVIRDIKLVHGSSIFIEGSVTFDSRVIALLLERCEKVAVFVLTIGSHLEETACQLAEDGLILQSSVLDAIGSVATENVAGFVQDRINKMAAAQGLCASLRFSPGYCDWDIGQQRMVFRAMNGDSAGVSLTEECLMLPQKSVSGIIGIGPRDSNIENYNPCYTCKKRNCPGRR